MVGGGQNGAERVPEDGGGDAGLLGVVDDPPARLGGLAREASDAVVERIEGLVVGVGDGDDGVGGDGDGGDRGGEAEEGGAGGDGEDRGGAAVEDWGWRRRRRELVGIFEIGGGLDGVCGEETGKTVVVREEVIAVATGSIAETKHHFFFLLNYENLGNIFFRVNLDLFGRKEKRKSGVDRKAFPWREEIPRFIRGRWSVEPKGFC